MRVAAFIGSIVLIASGAAQAQMVGGVAQANFKELMVVPVPQVEQGGKNTLTDPTVRNPEGEPIGTLDKLIMDAKTGKVEYGVVALKDDERLVPLAWKDLTVQRDSGRVVLQATKEQLQPAISRGDIKNLNPELWEYLDDIVQRPAKR